MKAEHHMRHQIWAFLQHLYSFLLLWKLPKSHQRPLILQRALRINFRRTAGYCFNTALPNRITAWMSRCTWSFDCYTIQLTLTDCQMEENQLTGLCGCVDAQISQDDTHNSWTHCLVCFVWNNLSGSTCSLCTFLLSLCQLSLSVLSLSHCFMLPPASPLLSPSHILTHTCTLTLTLSLAPPLQDFLVDKGFYGEVQTVCRGPAHFWLPSLKSVWIGSQPFVAIRWYFTARG